MGQKEELKRKYKTLNPLELRENIKRLFLKLKNSGNPLLEISEAA